MVNSLFEKCLKYRRGFNFLKESNENAADYNDENSIMATGGAKIFKIYLTKISKEDFEVKTKSKFFLAR